MTLIEVYPSNLPGEPIERHKVARDTTLGGWLRDMCPSYCSGKEQPLVASCNGEIIPAYRWDDYPLAGETIQLRPLPRELTTWLIVGALILGAVAVAVALKPKIPGASNSDGVQGKQLKVSDIQANQPRLNGVIPEIAGRYKVFPDYLSQPRRVFTSPTVQQVEMLLCIGQGDFAIDPDEIFVEKTPLPTLSDIIAYQIFPVGSSLAGTRWAQIWHNCREVGGSTDSAGLRLTSGAVGTKQTGAGLYRVESKSISVYQGNGVMPQDWDVGNVVTIVANIRTIIIYGGATPSDYDQFQGDFSDLNLAAGDIVEITGPYNILNGYYEIITTTNPVNEPGTPSSITGSLAPTLLFASTPISFGLNYFDVNLNADFADIAALIAELSSQVTGVTFSTSGGVIVVTEDTPYAGAEIMLNGNFNPVFGNVPVKVTGTQTRTYSVFTADKYQSYTDPTTGELIWDWIAATDMSPGTYAGCDLFKIKFDVVLILPYPKVTITPTQYRITALLTGWIPGGTGTIGFEFERLLLNGNVDTGWTGFPADTTSTDVKITLQSYVLTGGWAGPFRVTPGNEYSRILEYDIFAPGGLCIVDDEGNLGWRSVSIEMQWRSNEGAWQIVTQTMSGVSKDQMGWSFGLDMGIAYNNVDVRIRRTTPESGSLQILDRIEWYGLRCYLRDVNTYAGVTMIGLRIVGSDKISNGSENRFNMIVTRKLNGAANRTIADWLKYVCASVGYSTADINTAELDALAAIWNSRGDYYDNALVSQTTVKAELARVLQAGFAELTIDQGKIRAARDAARTTFEHLYTPQNMIGPLKRQWQAYDPDEFNGVDVEFVNAASWDTEVVECRLSGDAGTRVEKFSIDGVTDRTRAWRIGMRERRMQKYRRKTYQFETEYDALNSRYLSYCLLADDVPGYDQSAIVTDVSLNGATATLTVSELFTWAAGVGHQVALRRVDGTLSGPYTATRVGDYLLSIQGLDFSPIIPGNAQEPTHILFGATTNYHYDALITEINPGSESVSVSAVNYDSRVYDDDDNSPA